MSVCEMKRKLKQTGCIKRIRAKRALRKCATRYLLTEHEIKRAEKSDSERARILARKMNRYPQRAAEIGQKIDTVFKVRSIPENGDLRNDMLFCYFAYGFTPNEYVCYGLETKTAEERRHFISDRESICYGYRLNDIDARSVFRDKMETYERYSRYFGREAISVGAESDYGRFQAFVERHPVFVKKDVLESCGRSIELIDIGRYEGREKELFEQFRRAGKMILEEKVVQSRDIAVLNESSVNTVRCLTLNTREGVIVPWCFMKIGRKGSFVDNGGAGGLLVGIDCSAGTLNTDGIDEYGRRYQRHPDSGVELKGFQLPEWERMVAMCKEMAEMEPMVKWIGWDLAHTDSGWVVIEGNALSEVIGPQATGGESIRSELDRYMKNVDLFLK